MPTAEEPVVGEDWGATIAVSPITGPGEGTGTGTTEGASVALALLTLSTHIAAVTEVATILVALTGSD